MVQAVTTGLIECAEGVGVEAGDVVFTAQGVILEDLVCSVECAAADDAELGIEAFGGEGVFADVFPPYYISSVPVPLRISKLLWKLTILNPSISQSMHSLTLILANNTIPQRTPRK